MNTICDITPGDVHSVARLFYLHRAGLELAV